MDMIGHSIDRQRDFADLADYAAKVSVEIGRDFGFDERISVMRAEDEMDYYVRCGMGHALTPLRGWFNQNGCPTHGLRRGL
jgi:hypothetical protein